MEAILCFDSLLILNRFIGPLPDVNHKAILILFVIAPLINFNKNLCGFLLFRCEIRLICSSRIWIHFPQFSSNVTSTSFFSNLSLNDELSIDYIAPDVFERKVYEEDGFRNKFLEDKKRREERMLKNRIEKKRRLKENVSLED